MIAHIISNQWIVFDHITPWEEQIVGNRFSAVLPNRRFIDDTESQGWDGVYRKYNATQKKLARPFLGELRSLCKAKDLVLTVVDHRPASKYKPLPVTEINDDFLPGITLAPFQLNAIRRITKAQVGIIEVATGGGKGELIAGTCKAIPCPTVILAEQLVVIDQLKSRLQLRSVCEEPGIFCAGKTPSGQTIIIGSIQSLVLPKKLPAPPQRENYKTPKLYSAALKRFEVSKKAYRTRVKRARLLHKMIGKCEMLIADECDLCVTNTWKNLFRYWFKGTRRYGFTGTAFDPAKPVEKLVLQEHLGSVIYKQQWQDVEKAGLIVPIEYKMLAHVEDGDKNDSTAYDIAVDDMMINSSAFHNEILELCQKHSDVGILILVERDNLGHQLNNLIPNSAFIHGKTSKTTRPKILQNFESRNTNVLIGGKNVRRGMDLRGGCEILIIATGGALRSEFIQKIGRARRKNEAGKSIIYDFLFLCNKYLYAQSRARLKVAVGSGFHTEVHFRDGVIDGASFVRSRFRKPKRFKSIT